MSINVSVDQQGDSYILLSFSDTWTWRQLVDAIEDACHTAAGLPGQTCLIYELAAYMPASGLIDHIRDVSPVIAQNPDIGLEVYVVPDDGMRAMIQTATNRYSAPGRDVEFVAVLNDAIQIAHAH